ncbi:prevent-host-death family protein [Fervidobacterium changbaicum]|uniref:Antitoxin n=3 Tax=Fervidobacterium TaxID=2422 RepID=A0AAI8CKW4_FERIS|nr:MULTISPECIES: type II toxin-antitoxin system Phd/YefM family antitoxin [Fervidobacterium]AMW32256.1 type II toxin-antitoxin system Phd/YefM family antitoxin [Fervidobacterium islandicum]QAV32404.1 type II toxin-antitoxin system Phd/YefM family antitoxin [Fervidobacterium changbaicum]SDH18348.1 prevent-host-death family protein [Fervidobacterium changbaicum]
MRVKQDFYSLAEAKAKFSKVVDDAFSKDIIVTKNGKPAVVVMSYEKYAKILDFIDKVWDLYLLDLGDPSLFKELRLEEIFEIEENENSESH